MDNGVGVSLAVVVDVGVSMFAKMLAAPAERKPIELDLHMLTNTHFTARHP